MKKTVALIMALILAVAVFAGCDSNTSKSDSKKAGSKTVNENYDEMLDIMVKLIAGKELSRDQVKRMQPEDFLSYQQENGHDFSEYYEQVQKQLKTNENAMIAAFGTDYEVTYKITEDKLLTNDEQYQATKHLHSEPWYNAEEVGEVRALKLELSFSGEKNNKVFEAQFQALQYEKAWFALQFECDEMEAFMG